MPSRKSPRLWMQLGRHGLPGVIALGHYNNTRALPPLTEHVHPGAIEICFLIKGRQTYRVQGRDYRMRGGDVFVTFPDERHGTGNEPEEKGTLYWMILGLPRKNESFLGLPPRHGRSVLRGLLEMPSRHFHGSSRMKEDLDAIAEHYHASPDPPALASVRIAHHVQAVLLDTIRCSRLADASASRSLLAPVLDYIARHTEAPLRVSDLAARAGLSISRLSARFKAETGVPPAEYILRVKIEEAQRRLKQGNQTVTKIAYDLGFSSSQYFATAFRRFKGISPRDVRSRLRNGR